MVKAKDILNLDGPKKRILMAASEVFAEHGFADGTTREIAKRADANVAAISYHFGSKEQLYEAVLSYGKAKAYEKFPVEQLRDQEIPPEERLKLFVKSMLEKALDEETSLWFNKMVARELMQESNDAFPSFLDDDIRTVLNCLLESVQELCGEDAEQEAVRFCAASVVGQCTFFTSNKLLLQAVFAVQDLDWKNIDMFTDYIVGFAFGAISSIGTKNAGKK